MTTLTPSQYEALPEAEKAYWEYERVTKFPEKRFGSYGSTGQYIPVMIPLADAILLVETRKSDLVDQYKEIQPNSRAFDTLAHTVMELGIILTKLKNLKR